MATHALISLNVAFVRLQLQILGDHKIFSWRMLQEEEEEQQQEQEQEQEQENNNNNNNNAKPARQSLPCCSFHGPGLRIFMCRSRQRVTRSKARLGTDYHCGS